MYLSLVYEIKKKFQSEGFFDKKHTLEEEILKLAKEFQSEILKFTKDEKDEDVLILEYNKFVKFLANSATGLHRNLFRIKPLNLKKNLWFNLN